MHLPTLAHQIVCRINHAEKANDNHPLDAEKVTEIILSGLEQGYESKLSKIATLEAEKLQIEGLLEAISKDGMLERDLLSRSLYEARLENALFRGLILEAMTTQLLTQQTHEQRD